MKSSLIRRTGILLVCLFSVLSDSFAKDGEQEGTASVLKLELPAAYRHAPANKGSVEFIGAATVLIRYGGMTVLTDPNFLHRGEHVHLGYGLTSQRLTDPAIEFDRLPPVDLVLLSHMHEDHFDRRVQKQLNRNIPIVTTPEAAAKLEKLGFRNRYALAAWDVIDIRKGATTLRMTSMPGRHGPPVINMMFPQVMGAMLDFASADGFKYRMYISGDTLIVDDISQIQQRYHDIDLSLLHLGGTRILGTVKVTMDGKDGVKMLQIVAPRRAIPIHYNDYDVFKSTLREFEEEVAAAGLQDKIIYLKHGDTYEFMANRRDAASPHPEK